MDGKRKPRAPRTSRPAKAAPHNASGDAFIDTPSAGEDAIQHGNLSLRPRHALIFRLYRYLSSMIPLAAGAAGFLTLIQSGDRPDR